MEAQVKTLVLTGYDSAFAPLGELTKPLVKEYARRHGFGFLCLREPPSWKFPTGGMEHCPGNWHPSWWKMWLLPYLFKICGRVLWIDADMVVTNPEVVPPGESGYHCSLDWGVDATEPWMLTNCCFAAFPDCVPLVQWVLENRENISCEFHEQNHMREAAKQGFCGDDQQPVITVHPSRVFAAVPVEVHPSVVDPWQPGDWLCHLTMVALEERVRLAKEFIGRAHAQRN